MASKSEKKWSHDVTAHDHPFDLEPGVFASNDPKTIAAALKRSAEDPKRGSDDPYRTAMSMLDFYINRAGANLTPGQRQALDQTKVELRQSFGR
jgi:hypothetical protein